METINFIEKFIIYIEDHIRENIDYDKVLRNMGVEPKSFITIFTSLTGMTPYEYQAKRRMTEIAYDLKAGHRRLIDIAKYYGYYDVDTFKTAYQKSFGISPYETERHLDKLDLTERLSFEIVPVDRPKYSSKYTHSESFRMVGAVQTFSLQNYNSRMKYDFLAYLDDNNILDELLRYNNGSIKGIIMYERYIDGEMELIIGVSSSLESPFEETYTETSEFVVFETQGIPSLAAQDIYQYIFRRWHLKEPRDLNCNFSMEVLKSQREFTSDYTRVQVWQALYDEI
ncbi:helix-turn-helix domain-containing protein [Salinicoccus sesuvii]|uniref:Helix-turn-helix domain-containing protein n=1 Tax=Salinicoccus sesuvii TaxID=868281 RepID=A0ABV7N6I6_9STAP